ncbi:MAG TPA: nuclear transport factor 2 family protein [Solirubrobacteraceae bacterium]|jgi:ketosteroid isomerase-like protein|nr:nuclear transport factor 2 family protein [Solirubrobacteraceae bacterium]
MPAESTTPDLVRLWRESADAADRRDFDTAMRYFAADALWEVRPLGISLEGAPAIRSFLEDWVGSYEQYEYEQEEACDLGNGVVFVVSRLDARPLGSPGRVQERWAFTFAWTAGMIVRVMGHTDVDQARAAAERLAKERR